MEKKKERENAVLEIDIANLGGFQCLKIPAAIGQRKYNEGFKAHTSHYIDLILMKS